VIVTSAFLPPDAGVIVKVGAIVPLVTVRTAVPGSTVVDGSVAVMVATPVAIPVARPWVDTVAVVFIDDVQVTESVRSLLLRSEYRPVAVNCSVWPTPMEATVGVTVTDNRTGDPKAWAVSAMPELANPPMRTTDRKRAFPPHQSVRRRCRNVSTPYSDRKPFKASDSRVDSYNEAITYRGTGDSTCSAAASQSHPIARHGVASYLSKP
jgi:hypothetical protein